jgi:hypothetical protein
MSRCSDVPAGGPSDLESPRESGRLDDGSIDYDLYRTLARRLRQDFVAQTTLSLAGLAIRASMLLAAWIGPRPNHPWSFRKASISPTSLGQAGSPASTT